VADSNDTTRGYTRALADSRVRQSGGVWRARHENRRRSVRPWISSADVTSAASRIETIRGAVSAATATKLYAAGHCC